MVLHRAAGTSATRGRPRERTELPLARRRPEFSWGDPRSGCPGRRPGRSRRCPDPESRGDRRDYYGAISFAGLIQVTDDLGGVDVVVPETTSNGAYTFTAGPNHLNGE
ncbi:LCP family protein, partial [Modestobacter sp. KNN46-3]|uniref:LCP family glycopolymer transferase n=1 Tax=Modestobacter sp. KNN46-3 TaxID=2711218 RepID=UPI001F1571BE